LAETKARRGANFAEPLQRQFEIKLTRILAISNFEKEVKTICKTWNNTNSTENGHRKHI